MATKILTSEFRNVLKSLRVVRCTATASAAAEKETTVNVDEMDKFRYDSAQWWDLFGETKPLHSMNGLRIPLIRDGILHAEGVSSDKIKTAKPLSNFRILDVGCGGGILSEPLARLGGKVTAIDPNQDAVRVARNHASCDPQLEKNLAHSCESIEQHLSTNETPYDAVVVSEVAEHIDNVRLLVESSVKLTKAGGSLFFTTINKNMLSWFLTIFVAEQLLRALPKGTHSYDKLIPPQELEHLLKTAGAKVVLIHGMIYNPLNNTWYWCRDTSVNYAMHAIKV